MSVDNVRFYRIAGAVALVMSAAMSVVLIAAVVRFFVGAH